ncbi:MAG: DUF1592 domain-containing protein [Pirellulales bacterium]|nr:DUF1592 domain-containing protein [Pirellulales bacterium]
MMAQQGSRLRLSQSDLVSTLTSTLVLIFACLVSFAPCEGQEIAGRSPVATFEKSIRPFIVKYCINCHGPTMQKASLRLDTLDGDLQNGNMADTWQEVLDVINLGEMPPKDFSRQPSSQERRAAVTSLTTEFRRVLETQRSTAGRNIIRRLTTYEYNNTLRDLLQLDLRFSTDLPPEGAASEGFKNNSSVLGMSALHLEYFERIARSALSRILLVPEEKPPSYVVRIEPELAYKQIAESQRPIKTQATYNLRPLVAGKAKHKGLFKLVYGEILEDATAIVLAGNRPIDPVNTPFSADRKIGGSLGDGRSGYQPEFIAELYEIPPNSPVRVTIRAAARPGKGHSLPRLSFELGSFRGNGVSDQKEAANFELQSEEFQNYEFIVHGANFPFQSNKPSRPSYLRIFNEFRRGTSDLAYEDLPKLMIDWVEIESNYYPEWPTAQNKAILIESPSIGDELEYVRDVLRQFMKRAYRRPVSDHEVERKAILYENLRPAHESFEDALVSTLTAVLCSSHFLLIAEPASQPIPADTIAPPRDLNDYELATRLSYFLWSSMPDAKLFKLADQKLLRDPLVLQEQVHRMLKDPRAEAFSKNFTSQWLDLDGIRRLAVNPEYFVFEEKTKDLFEKESIQFLHHVLTNNLSLDNFIHSDFVVLNHKLAKHYRIPGISGGFEVRTLGSEHHRGGFLTQASILFGNSTGSETHPIRRGMWVLERMLDNPPPPPPPNVPELTVAVVPEEEGLPLKQRLVAHTNVQSCRDCHSKIDPWGLAFENYNALGQWREGNIDPNVKPPHQQVSVDPSTKLQDGHQIQNLHELKRYLLTDKKEEYRRAVVRKMMSYALGRYLDFRDRPAIDSICMALSTNDDKIHLLIERIVLSEPFLSK